MMRINSIYSLFSDDHNMITCLFNFYVIYFIGSNSINHSSLPASLEHMFSTDQLIQHRLQSAGII